MTNFEIYQHHVDMHLISLDPLGSQHSRSSSSLCMDTEARRQTVGWHSGQNCRRETKVNAACRRPTQLEEVLSFSDATEVIDRWFFMLLNVHNSRDEGMRPQRYLVALVHQYYIQRGRAWMTILYSCFPLPRCILPHDCSSLLFNNAWI